jgi:hypothetical protein
MSMSLVMTKILFINLLKLKKKQKLLFKKKSKITKSYTKIK